MKSSVSRVTSPTNQSFSGDYCLHFDGWINVNGPFPGGSLQLVASGQNGATYVIETSTNLVNWTAFTDLVATNGVLKWNFVPPANDLQRFFRARSGP